MARLYFEDTGHGRPIVLWHGWGLNLRVFDPLRDALASHHRVVAVDLPGHGRSGPWGGAGIEEGLAALAGTIPDDATLVGWSLGGQLALRFAAEAEHWRGGRGLRALVLIATTPRFTAAPDWPHGLAAEVVAGFARRLTVDPRGLIGEFLELQVRGTAGADAVRGELARALAEHGYAQREALTTGLGALRDHDLRPLLPAIRLPTLLVAGRNDRITPPAAMRELARSIAGAEHVEIARAGHAPFLSHLPELLPVLESFLERNGA